LKIQVIAMRLSEWARVDGKLFHTVGEQRTPGLISALICRKIAHLASWAKNPDIQRVFPGFH
jgi:hypothetical protein